MINVLLFTAREGRTKLNLIIIICSKSTTVKYNNEIEIGSFWGLILLHDGIISSEEVLKVNWILA